MRFEHTVRIAAPRAAVWELLMDVPRVAACVPGAEAVTAIADGSYRGALRVQVGPIRVRLEGQLAIVERDEQAGTASMRLDAADTGSASGVTATIGLFLGQAGDLTELRLETDARILGRLGELGQPIIKRKADQIIREFARDLEQAAGARP